MSISSFHRISACVLVMALCVPVVQAQDAATLKRENARLNAELVQLRNQCGAGSGAGLGDNGLGAEQRVGDLVFSVASVRVGSDNGRHIVTTTLRIRNLGSVPVALNYNASTFSLVDDHGYRYLLSGSDKSVSGISTTYASSAGTDDVVLPGDNLNVTFQAQRYPEKGETAGNRFDLNTTFGAYEDQGQSRIRRVRNYAAAFVGIPRSAGAQAVGESVRQSGRNVVEGVLKGLFGNGN